MRSVFPVNPNRYRLWSPRYNRPFVVPGLLVCLFLMGGCSRHIKAFLAKGGPQSPTAEKCGECHIEIYQEWKGSAHAESYRSLVFKKITADYRIEECLPCHVPETILEGEEVRVRSWRREEGITCVNCHWLNDRLHGPLDIPNPFPPHPVGENDRRFRQSGLCGKCHREALKEWEEWKGLIDREGESKPTCQDCHMIERRRELIQDPPWRWLQSRKRTGRHTWDPRDGKDPARSVDLKILLDSPPPGEVAGRVVIRNRGLGHALPTGGFGYAEVALLITLEDSWGIPLDHLVLSFYQELKTSIRAGEERDIPFHFLDSTGKGIRLRAQLVRTSFDRKVKRMIAQAERTLVSPGTAGRK